MATTVTSTVETLMNEQSVRDLIARQIAGILLLEPADVDPTKTFDEYGLDSVDSLIAVSMVEEQLKIELPPELFLQNRTIDDVIKVLRARGDIA